MTKKKTPNHLKTLQKEQDALKSAMETVKRTLETEKISAYQFMKNKFGIKEDLTLENHLLKCPLGVQYFLRYLNEELNEENLVCYFDTKSLIDYVQKHLERKESLERQGSSMRSTVNLDDISPAFRDYFVAAQQDVDDSATVMTVDTIEEGDDSDDEGEEVDMQSPSPSPASSTPASNTPKQETAPIQQESSFMINKTIEAFAKLSIEEMRASAEDVFARTKSLFSEYVLPNSPKEVNLPSTIRNPLLEHLQEIERIYLKASDKEREEVSAAALSEVVEKSHRVLYKLEKELLSNLMDPFYRFAESPLSLEMISVIVSPKWGYVHQRQQLLRSNVDAHVLNENLKVEWTKEMGGRHPLTVVNSQLETILSMIANAENWAINMTSSEVNEIGQLQFNYDDFFTAQRRDSSGRCHSWNVFEDNCGELKQVSLDSLKGPEQQALFFVNLYNLLLLHGAVLSRGIPKNTVSRNTWLRKITYNVDGHKFSLDDIKYGILGKNASSSVVWGKRIKNNDPRLKYVIQDLDDKLYRLLPFALIDCSHQSPEATILTNSSSLLEQVEASAKSYIAKNVVINDKANTITLPSFLREYAKQITGKASIQALLDFVFEYKKSSMTDEQKRKWESKKLKIVWEAQDFNSDYLRLISDKERAAIQTARKPTLSEQKQIKKAKLVAKKKCKPCKVGCSLM